VSEKCLVLAMHVRSRPIRKLTPPAPSTVEFDANARGPWMFKPAQSSMQVHPGEMMTVMYEFQNVQNRVMSAQAIPSYAPRLSGSAFQQSGVFLF